jgi:cytochrome c biogenesis protein CcdA
MKWVKYVAATLCALLAISTVPSVCGIGIGLTGSHVEDPIYFCAKLLAYILEIVILGIAAVKLYRSARSETK